MKSVLWKNQKFKKIISLINMAFCIGCGKFNRNYFFILFAILCKLISQLALGLKYSVFKEIQTFNLKLAPITYFTSSFLFSSIFGSIFYI